jgi:hypothetical protein
MDIFMHNVHHSFHIVNRRVLQNAMSQIEDVTGSAFGATQDVLNT